MKINSITIDSTNSITDLCRLGAKYPTDKSPYSTENYNTPNGSGHRHPYTSVYNFIFSSLRYQKIKLAEIGILDNMSMVCWREYFPKAELFGFEFNPKYLQLGKESELKNTTYDYIDVRSESSIINCLDKHGKFDIIIDDSTHIFEDQIRFCKIAYKYLTEGGILIIEDIFRNKDEENYEQALSEISKYFSTMTFILTEHDLLYSPGWNNDKLLILFRNNIQ
jgi:SAM-dependent methyltransferase